MGQCGRMHRDEIPDDLLADFYLRLNRAGRERASFYSRPRMAVMEFVNLVRLPENHWWLLTFNHDMAGMIYLTDILGKSAMVHFCFLPLPAARAECGVPAPVALGRFGVSSILHDAHMDGVHILDVLTGKTPVWNRAAVKLICRCGAAIAGTIPSVCFSHDSGANLPGVISYYTRETVPAEWAAY